MSICDLKAVKSALSGDDDLDREGMYGLWNVVNRATDRLMTIKEDMDGLKLTPASPTR